MKKEVKIVLAVVLAVWFFVMGFEIGSYAEKKKFAQANSGVVTPTTQAPTVAPTEAPTTQPTQPDITAPTGSNTTAPTQGNTTDVSSLSKDEIVADVNKYMTQLRSEQNMTAHKTASVYVNVVDCSVPSIIGTINNVISGITDDLSPEETYTFSGGQAVDAGGSTVAPRDVIPPKGKDFSLPAQGVAVATAQKQGDNTVYSITLAAENTTIDNPVPPCHDASLGYLDITTLNLPIKVTRGDMHYPASTIILTVDSNGKVIGLNEKIPMNGDGATTVLGKEGTASFEGALEENWTFTY
ncbi:MAG: hypothetical protein IJW86_02525 [Clostridia bacterium]|nr:hypothetical protein [Clostridia bacterium]